MRDIAPDDHVTRVRHPALEDATTAPLVLVSHVADERRDPVALGGQLLEPLLVAGVGEDARPLLGQQQRGGPADAGRRARDDHVAIPQVHAISAG